MRLDKYLKVSRLIKRRTLAKEVASRERITINGKLAKPSSTIKIDDIIEITLGLRIITVKVTSLVILKDELMYQLIKDEKRSV